MFFILVFCIASVSFAGDLHGKYMVGRTSCIIKPIKMSYEVTWAKGVGKTYLFFEGKQDRKVVYKDTDGGEHIFGRFIFDSDKLDKGFYIRSDGKRYTVIKDINPDVIASPKGEAIQ